MEIIELREEEIILLREMEGDNQRNSQYSTLNYLLIQPIHIWPVATFSLLQKCPFNMKR